MHRNDNLLWKKVEKLIPNWGIQVCKCIVKRVIYVKYQNISNFHPPLFSDTPLIEGNVAFKPVSYVTMVKMFVPS